MKTLPDKAVPDVGDVVWVDLNPVIGHEKKKTRPCLVLQKKITPLDLVTVLPITDAGGKKPGLFFVTIPDLKQAGLKKTSVIDCYQIRTLSLSRIRGKIGFVGENVVDEAKKSLALILGIHSYHI